MEPPKSHGKLRSPPQHAAHADAPPGRRYRSLAAGCLRKMWFDQEKLGKFTRGKKKNMCLTRKKLENLKKKNGFFRQDKLEDSPIKMVGVSIIRYGSMDFRTGKKVEIMIHRK